MNGIMLGEHVLGTDEAGSKPIVETPEPEAPDGYRSDYSWVDAGSAIEQSWRLVPEDGSAAEAAVELARIQAQSLSDADAVRVAPLYDEWSGDGVRYYGPDDPEGHPQSRVRFQGYLVKCLQGHTSQPDWAPNAAPSLWAVILPGQDGSGVEVGIWQQPESTNGYSVGDKVIYGGHLWESIVNNNVDVPGTDNGFRWKDLGEWDGSAETAPRSVTGAHFARAVGDADTE